MAELEALVIFGIPILIVGALLFLAFGSGGWFNPAQKDNTAADKPTKLGYFLCSLGVFVVIGGISLERTVPDTGIGRFMSDDFNQRLFVWGCELLLFLVAILCELKGHKLFEKRKFRA